MKKRWLLPSMVFLLSCMQGVGATLKSFSAQCGPIRVNYALPVGASYLAGKPVSVIEFPKNRDFPLVGGIAAVGWGFVKDVPQIQIDLIIIKIATPQFTETVKSNCWGRILKKEGVSLQFPYSKSERLILDHLGREWLEVAVEEEAHITARSYIRPVAPDLLLLLRLNLMNNVTEKQRTDGMNVQNQIFESLAVESAKDASNGLE